MNKCTHCNVKIYDDIEYCPLCRGVLEEDGSHNLATYPNVFARRRAFSLIKRILSFVWVAATALAVFFALYFKYDITWTYIGAASSLYALIVVCTMTKLDAGPISKIAVPVIGGVALVVLVDHFTGFHRWSVNFVLPGAIFAINIFLIILMIINNQNFQSYMVFEILMILVGIIPLVLVGLRVVSFPLVSELAFLSSVILFLGTLIIGGRSAVTEMKRRFHV